ncbi:MAG: hypothetical protein L0312_33940 [Acidobacteria bacterium]|nr:hypothetical protein [Acidobacteriota bacterium]
MLAMLAGQKRKSDSLRAQRAISAFLLVELVILAFSSNIYGQISTAGKTDQGKLHGGIVIGPEGIRAAVIRLSDAEQASGAEVVYTKVFNMALVRTRDGKFVLEVIKAIGQTVLKLYTHMQEQYQVPPRQVYIIGSSDLDADVLDELANEVRNNTGMTITFLSLESEVRLGIIGTIPRRYREGTTWFDNRSQSVLIDIGGDKTKGGYQQARQPLVGNPYYDFVAVGIPVGTTTFADKVNQEVGEDADIKKFTLGARMLSEKSIKAALRKEPERKPGLAHRKKVYLKGAIVWAMATLLRPEDRRPFITTTVDDINIFHQRAVNNPQALLNPDLSHIRNDEIRMEVERDLEAVRSAFTPKRLIAGAEVLKAIASEYNFREEGKKILFARFGNLSLILSYVLLQAENGPQP